MSKLLDKLRSATRSRNAIVSIGKPLDSALLSTALRRAQAERAALRAANEHLEVDLPESQSPAAIEQERAAQQVEAALQEAIVEDREVEAAMARAEAARMAEDAALLHAREERRTRALIIALVAMALVAAAAAWNHAAPPARTQPLKLDYGLDVTRTDASGRSSLPDPGRSK